ncbi:MAG: EscD/YscD/HrpQ family type III secretion system periplasmic domain-containing protein [Candidatus Competibacteraceae bacterium]
MTHEYLGNGVVRLQGYLPDTLTHEELAIIVRSDVPAIQRIEGKVRTLGDWVAELRSWVEDVGLDEQVFIEARGERVLATGLVGPEVMKVWQPIAKQFAADTGNLPPLESLVKIAENLAEVGNPEIESAQPLAQTRWIFRWRT